MGHDYRPSRYVTKKAPNSINITDRSQPGQRIRIFLGEFRRMTHGMINEHIGRFCQRIEAVDRAQQVGRGAGHRQDVPPWE